MRYDIKKLKSQYDGKKIGDCVNEVKNLYLKMTEFGEQLVGLLWYLEKTKRYREYDGYKKLEFKIFVNEVCHITYNRYRELAYAYNWYPDESRKYGPQTIQYIRDKVGVIGVPKVLREIDAKTNKIKDPIKRREAVFNIIEKHSPPKTAKAHEDTKGYWKNKYEKLLADFKALQKENNELQAQIERQKPAVSAFMKMQDTVKDYRQPRVSS